MGEAYRRPKAGYRDDEPEESASWQFVRCGLGGFTMLLGIAAIVRGFILGPSQEGLSALNYGFIGGGLAVFIVGAAVTAGAFITGLWQLLTGEEK